MPCYHPMTAIVTGQTENGKKKLRFLRPLEKLPDVDPEFLVKIPCGQCIGCRMEYSRVWANRCMMEAQMHEHNVFITLTYNDEHVPLGYTGGEVRVLTGEVIEEPRPVMTLKKRDFQLFMKRLRKEFSDERIRFFACGEYGDSSFRPHYHAVIFGLNLDDLKVYKKNFKGQILYNSERLQKCWRDRDGNDIGYAVVAEVTWETCAYTARYVMKKVKGLGKEEFDKLGIEPEFCLMSRKPGLAHDYFERWKDEIYDVDRVYLTDIRRGRNFRPPRYFDNLFDLEYPERLERIKEARKTMARAMESNKALGSDYALDHLMEIEERSVEKRLKGLVRTL